MNFKMILLSVFVGVFVFMMAADVPFGFIAKCGTEQAYAMGPRLDPPGHPGHPRRNPRPVPEPSGIIMLGIGLAAVGSYYAFRSRKK